jgi:hypothetical protein
MIVFDLECRTGNHRFEGWFGSSDDFVSQQERGLVSCPECGSADVGKALMAPNIGRKGNQIEIARPAKAQPMSNGPMSDGPMGKGASLPPEAVEMMQKLAVMQTEALKQSRWVGESFADDARAMHYGEREVENIHGQATVEEAKELLEEGIEVAPLPFPVAPPGKAN